jgi:hypothetical protein
MFFQPLDDTDVCKTQRRAALKDESNLETQLRSRILSKRQRASHRSGRQDATQKRFQRHGRRLGFYGLF